MLETAITLGYIVPILIVLLALVTLYKGIKIVPQSEVYVVERFGKYTKTLKAGLNLLIPFLDKISAEFKVCLFFNFILTKIKKNTKQNKKKTQLNCIY